MTPTQPEIRDATHHWAPGIMLYHSCGGQVWGRSPGCAGATTIELGHGKFEGQRASGPGGQRGQRGSRKEGTGLCCSPNCERRTKPLRPPMRPLHRLEIGTQHTIKHLENHPTAWLRWAGMRQRRTAVLEEIGFRWSPVCGSPTLVSVCGEVNELVQQHLPPGAPIQQGDTRRSPNFETVLVDQNSKAGRVGQPTPSRFLIQAASRGEPRATGRRPGARRASRR